MRDRGSMLIVTMLVAVAISASVVQAMTPVLIDLRDQQRARSAADASALAGVEGGQPAADRLASLNGGVLVSWSATSDTVTVTVRVGTRTATARATNGP